MASRFIETATMPTQGRRYRPQNGSWGNRQGGARQAPPLVLAVTLLVLVLLLNNAGHSDGCWIKVRTDIDKCGPWRPCLSSLVGCVVRAVSVLLSRTAAGERAGDFVVCCLMSVTPLA